MKDIAKLEKYQSVIEKIFLFTGIEKKKIQQAFRDELCKCVQFEPNEVIYSKTNFNKSIGVVLSGELAAQKPIPDGNRVVLNTFFTGGVFGVAGLFHDAEHYVSEVTAIKRSKVLFLPQQLLQQLIEENPKIALNYISYLSNRICFLNSRIDNFTGGTAQGRLAAYLLNLSEQSMQSSKSQPRIVLPCSLTQLSKMLDIGRASLYRAFDSLAEAGLVQKDGKTITLIQVERLKAGQL